MGFSVIVGTWPDRSIRWAIALEDKIVARSCEDYPTPEMAFAAARDFAQKVGWPWRESSVREEYTVEGIGTKAFRKSQ